MISEKIHEVESNTEPILLALSHATRDRLSPYALLWFSRTPPDDNVENIVFLHSNQGL